MNLKKLHKIDLIELYSDSSHYMAFGRSDKIASAIYQEGRANTDTLNRCKEYDYIAYIDDPHDHDQVVQLMDMNDALSCFKIFLCSRVLDIDFDRGYSTIPPEAYGFFVSVDGVEYGLFDDRDKLHDLGVLSDDVYRYLNENVGSDHFSNLEFDESDLI